MLQLMFFISSLLAYPILYADSSAKLSSGTHGGNTLTMKFVANVDGKSFSRDHGRNRNWTDAEIYCNTFGMTLASVTSKAQIDALTNAYDSTDFRLGYWTSGRDSSRISQFAWNRTDTIASSEYLPFYNYGTNPYQTCLAFNSRPNNSSIFYPCPCSTLSVTGVLCET